MPALVLAGVLIGALTPIAMSAGAQGPFVDDDDSVHEADISWIAQAGITSGCNPPQNDQYCPDDAVTRGQMAAFLTRALDLAPSTGTFTDTQAHIFRADIAALAQAGITSGCNPPQNDQYCPDDAVTRGQMATFLRRSTNHGATTATTQSTSSTTPSVTSSTSTSTTTPTSTTTSTSTTSSTTTTTQPVSGGPPVLDAVGDQWIVAGTEAEVELTASHDAGRTVTFHGESLPSFVDIEDGGDGTALLNIAPPTGGSGIFEFEVVVSDDTGKDDREEVTLSVQPDTTGNDGPWLETNGLLLIDVESAPVVPNWDLVLPPGALGGGAFEWTVADQWSPGEGVISYPFEIHEPGTYRISARSRRSGTGSSDSHNDMFVKLDDGNWTKFFQLGGTHKVWEWRHRREYQLDGGTHQREDWLVDLEAGSHVIRIAGRSVQFQLDRIALHRDHATFPQDHFPESPRG